MLNPELPLETPLSGRTTAAGDSSDAPMARVSEGAAGSQSTTGQGPNAGACLFTSHVHVGVCQRAGYHFGYTDGQAALVAEVQRLRTVEAAVEALASRLDGEEHICLSETGGYGCHQCWRDEIRTALAAARTGEASDG